MYLPKINCQSVRPRDQSLRPTQTERDYKTRRDFFVFKSKQNRLWKEILQDMQTK